MHRQKPGFLPTTNPGSRVPPPTKKPQLSTTNQVTRLPPHAKTPKNPKQKSAPQMRDAFLDSI
ncbi:hypothetical protein CK510_15225 [Brunnivagina elsteri CCALA 953]|uniref:Uncharacterized protein n=1 Tax=Brunnivagina elsteri CCALA 953 TaxID=987040 RepID=A0A2A2THV7_9CYAN|nr:hypothetical protein CK510_15225 [Calothrix elsteri CCALA 953]